MAKKKEESSEPVISSIPVPPSDSALVIDLPDGQKLLVGKIETGTVIEVATWRGTGRPDSRTNRLMLGMSNEADAKKQQSESAEPRKAAPKSVPEKFLFKVISIIKLVQIKIRPMVKSALSGLSKLPEKLKGISKPNLQKKSNAPKSDSPLNMSSEMAKIEDDFEKDFQRLLDQVSERRAKPKSKAGANKSKPVQKAESKGKAPKKSNNTKSKVR